MNPSIHVGVRPLPQGLVERVVETARDVDRATFQHTGEALTVEGLERSCAQADALWWISVSGEPAGIWGLIDCDPITGKAFCWLVSTTVFDRCRHALARVSRGLLDALVMRRQSCVQALVDVDNEKSLSWLAWLGFEHIGFRVLPSGQIAHVVRKESAWPT